MRGCLILLLGSALWAQAPEKYPLETLRVQGNQQIPAERIVAASGLKIGSPVQKADFDAARERLLESGAFESVGYSFKPAATNSGYDATFEVVEVAMLYPYRFEGLPGQVDALRAALRKQEPLLGDHIPATPQVLNRYTAAIRRFFEGKVEAASELTSDSGPLEIVFRPPGERARISEVNFTGNQVILTALLTGKLSQSAIGIPYSEPLFRRVLDSAIRPLYEERGRIRVAFPEISVKKSEKNDGVDVTIAVSEGPAYTLGTVAMAGLPTAEVEQLAKLEDWHKGETANFTNVEANLEKIRQRQRAKGYLRAQTSIVREIRDQDYTVNLTINIEPGPQFTLSKLNIQGLDVISEPAIRKMWKIEPGQPFQDGYPEAFLNRVRDEGIFDNLGKTRAESNIDESSHTVDVTLFFSGAREPAKGKDDKRR
ncbi:MAG: FtsQ-type POTRA domain-containing protein [Acidobacteriia bacterium]|nr:FtsQ-type POTRA domain-containing protein [Terriglobia bacterium]